MPRRRVAAKRTILPDPVFENTVVAKFVNRVMKSGKKSVAERIVYGALDKVMERSKKGDAVENKEVTIELFTKALDNVRPAVEVKSRRVGGSTYQVPVEVRAERGTALAMRWLVESAKKRSEKTMALRLAGEMLDAIDGRGTAVKKREDTHRMAKANEAFSHYRW